MFTGDVLKIITFAKNNIFKALVQMGQFTCACMCMCMCMYM